MRSVKIIILFVSGMINYAGNGGNWGLGWIYFAHFCFVVAVLVFHKLLWQILALPGKNVAGRMEVFVKGTGQKVFEAGKLATRATIAAATGNAGVLLSKGNATKAAASLLQMRHQQQSKTGDLENQQQKSEMGALKNQQPNFIPADFSTERMSSLAQSLTNPYQKETDESVVFEDMKQRGLNPYSSADRDVYTKDLLKNGSIPNEKKEAISKIGNDAREFEKRRKQIMHNQRISELRKKEEEFEMKQWELERREREERRRNSFPHKILSRFRSGGGTKQ